MGINESDLDLHAGKLLDIEFTDDNGDKSTIEAMLDDIGYGIDRQKLYYDFTVTKTNDPEKYPINSTFILPLNFDNINSEFLIHKNNGGNLHYKAYSRILNLN